MKKYIIRAAALILSAAMLLSGCTEANTSSNVDSTSSVTSSDSTSAAEQTSAAESSEEQSSAPDTSAEQTSAADTSADTQAEESSAPEQQSGFDVEWRLSSTWMDGDKYCGGYDVVVTNNTDTSLESWKAEFDVPNGFELVSQWNGKFEVNGTKVTVTNEEYNGALEKGKNISFGFNYSSPEEFTPDNITVNGTKASSTVSTQGSSNNSTPEQTTLKPIETVPPAPEDPDGATPVATHGQLSVKGTQLVDKNGDGYQLKGMSTHGIGWFPDFVNEQAFRTLRDDWHTNAIRMAMYSGAGEGYTGDGIAQYEALMRKGIEIAIKLDMYVIVDWHLLQDQSPQVRKDDALRFFDEISKQYGDYPNVLYEICNEPNGYATWDGDVKPYAEEVIPVIRANDPDSVILVGSPTWSQDIDKALADPLDFDNVMYTLHFYAATHTDWLRDRAKQCVSAGLPIFVSEFGCCDASGNGANDFNQATQWLSLLDSMGVSYMNWALANKDEACCVVRPSGSADGNWGEDDLSEAGNWIRHWFRGEVQG